MSLFSLDDQVLDGALWAQPKEQNYSQTFLFIVNATVTDS